MMNLSTTAPRFLSLAIGLAVLTVTGCGGSSGDITGTVKYRGQMLKTGSVQFQVPGGGILTSPIGADGKYSIKGCKVGTAKILVSCVDEEGKIAYYKAKSAAGKGAIDGKGPSGPTGGPEQFDIVPQSYSDFDTSGLTFEVKAGSNTHDLDLVAR
ncbi:hypothetical protein BH11PLA2_BH11PLA2_06600 [soil metagenome]